MTNKTMIQIASIKNNYNFGVEVEMNHISRRDAAECAALFFGTDRFEFTAALNGYMTWSAWDESGREWKFSKDVSITGPDDEKCELVTPILEYDDIPMLQELLRRLRKAGAVSNPRNGCGVHIHVSRKDGFTVQNVKNLVNIMASHEEQIGRAIFIDQRRTWSYCKVVDPDFLRMMHKKNPKTVYRKIVTVDAASESEAHQRVSDAWTNTEFRLSHEDFDGVEFRVVGEGSEGKKIESKGGVL